MRYLFSIFAAGALFGLYSFDAAAQNAAGNGVHVAGQSDRCYELRVYTSPEGELDDLNRRFAKYSRRVFAKYDMTPVGFWIPIDNPDNKFYYVLSYPSCAARDTSWARFFRDPEWLHVKAITEAEVDPVTHVENTFMHAADFSPTIGPWMESYPRVYELRTYYSPEGRFENLLARFRDHTLRIFANHGMTNIAYWIDRDAERLIYLLAYPSEHFREEAWQEFRMDPEWQRVSEESQRDGSIVSRVESVLLEPTEYSPLR